jgi:hypothetical protein
MTKANLKSVMVVALGVLVAKAIVRYGEDLPLIGDLEGA